MIEFWLNGSIQRGTIVKENEDGTFDIEIIGGNVVKNVEEQYIVE